VRVAVCQNPSVTRHIAPLVVQLFETILSVTIRFEWLALHFLTAVLRAGLVLDVLRVPVYEETERQCVQDRACSQTSQPFLQFTFCVVYVC